MTCRAIRVAVLLSVLPLAGCGTAANLVGAGPGKKVPFGGVRHDVASIAEARGGDIDLTSPDEWGPKQHRQAAMIFLCAADLPLSLVGDLVSWPYTRTYSYINQPNDYVPIQIAPPYAGPGPAAPVPPAAPGVLPAVPAAPGLPAPQTPPAVPAVPLLQPPQTLPVVPTVPVVPMLQTLPAVPVPPAPPTPRVGP